MIVEANVFPYNKMFPHMKEQFVLEFTKVLRVLFCHYYVKTIPVQVFRKPICDHVSIFLCFNCHCSMTKSKFISIQFPLTVVLPFPVARIFFYEIKCKKHLNILFLSKFNRDRCIILLSLISLTISHFLRLECFLARYSNLLSLIPIIITINNVTLTKWVRRKHSTFLM